MGSIGWTAMHFAARNGNRHLSDLVLKSDGDINAVNSDNRTPLHMAVTMTNTEYVGYLIDNGADCLTTSGVTLQKVI